ncbi:hypothetical protein A2707_00545 [Candidatus Saccharibacteria bacterium RIFCSPHIGHO2_01_FULL_45_15]|nr:MAG: hypothetical protein A2707_00545 [Candidatus Saccharibacteria bacterium RIFCSPHIGHO2_01_FULL_45_15]OGL26866.1 MAG: hypothetical protein A3C39_01660 [Candidatus Saccharibacteria bacterium RIFCSPHIGHO2_02_FULL_46_12]OGL32173.1 MAG: hypothetical protein A3E76_04205 [Candidatus Saccharibacteria bacterium RIFCSPHIGHO2_12_FULL_44_22]
MANHHTPIDYSYLFRSLPGRHIIVDVDDPVFTLIDENEAHARVALTTRENVVGKPFFDVFPDTSEKFKKTGVSDITESFNRVIATGKPDTMDVLKYDIKNSHGDFVERFWQVTHYPLLDEDNSTVIAILQQTEDITEHVKTEERLADTQYQLDEALAIGQIGTWAWDVQGDTVVADKNLARMFGVPVDVAASGISLETFTNAIYSEDRARVVDEIEAAVATGAAFESEYRTISTDGTIRWVIARGRISRNRKGEVVGFPGVVVDISDRKTAEQNLTFLAAASAELASSLDYTRTLHNLAHMIVREIADWCSVDILDDNGKLKQIALTHKDQSAVAWVKQLQKQQGEDRYNEDSAIGKVLATGQSEYYPYITPETPTDRSEDSRIIEKLKISSVVIAPLIVREKTVGTITFVSTEQKHHYTKSDLAMFEDLAKRISLTMTNTHFIEETRRQVVELDRLRIQLQAANEALETRVKRRTAQLEVTNLNLQRSNQELQDFAYVASHDLQEPLRKIQAFGTILQDEYAETLGEGGDYLVRMRSAAARMSTLIEDLLAFSRVTTHAKEHAEIDLTTIIGEVLEDLEARIGDTHGTVSVGKLPKIHADPMQMRQLFQNLIGNALKFHRPDIPPNVIIESTIIKPTSNSNGTYEIRVSDNGVGFDEKYLDRIFAVFQRLHGRDSYEGTGIGLAVCRKIVERHNGEITATSTPGKGSTFIIRLPIKKQEKQAAKGVPS